MVYACVILAKCKAVLIVNAQWVEGIHKYCATVINNLPKTHTKRKIFFSRDENDTVNFDLNITKEQFDPIKPGPVCYQGYFLRSFGNYFENKFILLPFYVFICAKRNLFFARRHI